MKVHNIPTRDINVVIQLGSAVASITAEGVSYNPTIARDMQDRAVSMMAEVLAEAAKYGVPVAIDADGYAEIDDDDQEDDDG